MKLYVISVIYFIAVLTVSHGQERVDPLNQTCLGCICEAVSGCNRELTCRRNICGAFKLTWPYWADSGKPTLTHDDADDPEAYKRCANDPYCAASSVKGYVERFKQDCNNDGVIDCIDYSAIHLYGGYGCRAPDNNQFWGKLMKCLNNTQKPNDDLE